MPVYTSPFYTGVVSGPRINAKPTNDWRKTSFFKYGDHKPCETIDDTLVEYGLNWEVTTVPIRSNTGGDFDMVNFHEHVGVIRMDNSEPLAVVGSNIYTPIQNREALEMFEKIMHQENMTIEAGGCFDGGKRIWVAAKLPSEINVRVGNEIKTILKYMIISWSHDQSAALTVRFLPKLKDSRVSLASFVPGVTGELTVKHTTNAKDRMDRGATTLEKALIFFEKCEEMLTQMANSTMSMSKFDEILAYLYPESEDEPKYDANGNLKKSSDDKTREAIKGCFDTLSPAMKETEFGAFVAICEYNDFEGRTRVTKGKTEGEQRAMSSLFGTAQKNKTEAFKTILNFERIKNSGGLKA